jgi:hypothetical protein
VAGGISNVDNTVRIYSSAGRGGAAETQSCEYALKRSAPLNAFKREPGLEECPESK